MHPELPDPLALRRRVLLTAILTFALFLAAGYVITALDLSGFWLLLTVAVLFGCVVRPMMAPVREATRLRRTLAYQAYLERREGPR